MSKKHKRYEKHKNFDSSLRERERARILRKMREVERSQN